MLVVPTIVSRRPPSSFIRRNSGARVPVIGSRLLASGTARRRRQPVHFAVTNAAKVGREGRGHSLFIWTAAESHVGSYPMCAVYVSQFVEC